MSASSTVAPRCIAGAAHDLRRQCHKDAVPMPVEIRTDLDHLAVALRPLRKQGVCSPRPSGKPGARALDTGGPALPSEPTWRDAREFVVLPVIPMRTPPSIKIHVSGLRPRTFGGPPSINPGRPSGAKTTGSRRSFAHGGISRGGQYLPSGPRGMSRTTAITRRAASVMTYSQARIITSGTTGGQQYVPVPGPRTVHNGSRASWSTRDEQRPP
jgi:hypothetical protein